MESMTIIQKIEKPLKMMIVVQGREFQNLVKRLETPQ